MRKSRRKSSSGRIRLLTSRGFKRYFALLIAATLFTWVTGQLDTHYEPLTHPGYGEVFPGNTEAWQLVGNSDLLNPESGTFQISPDTEHHTRAQFQIELPDYVSSDEHLVRARSVISTIQRPSTSSLSTDAGLLIRLLDAEEKVTLWGWVAQLSGEYDIHRDEQIIALDSSTDSVLLVFTNRTSDGSFELGRVTLDIVKISAIYRLVIFPGLLVLWSMAALIGGYYLATKLGRGRILLLGGVLLVLIGGVLLPASLRELIVTPVFNKLQSIGLIGSNMALMHYYKIGHFLTFFIVSLMLFRNKRRLRLSRIDICAVMLLLAVATEGAQLHLFYRSTQILDIVIDMAGVFLALLVHYIFLKTIYQQSKRRKDRTIRTRTSSRVPSASQTPETKQKKSRER